MRFNSRFFNYNSLQIREKEVTLHNISKKIKT